MVVDTEVKDDPGGATSLICLGKFSGSVSEK